MSEEGYEPVDTPAEYRATAEDWELITRENGMVLCHVDFTVTGVRMEDGSYEDFGPRSTHADLVLIGKPDPETGEQRPWNKNAAMLMQHLGWDGDPVTIVENLPADDEVQLQVVRREWGTGESIEAIRIGALDATFPGVAGKAKAKQIGKQFGGHFKALAKEVDKRRK